MTVFCPHQEKYAEQLVSLALNHQFPMKSILIVGPRGSGKRTISQAAAQDMGMDFVEVPVNDAAISVSKRLFGSPFYRDTVEADRSPPGELGRDSPTLLYLSGLQHVDIALCQDLQRLVTTRKYIDSFGVSWSVSEDLWIVAGFVYPERDRTINIDHWLCRAFTYRLEISPYVLSSELICVCENIIREYGSALEADLDIVDQLPFVLNAPDNLHALRRWIEAIVCSPENFDSFSVDSLMWAIRRDTYGLLDRLIYRGYTLPPDRLESWYNQFPPELQPLAVHLVNQIDQQYYIGQREFYDIVNNLIANTGIQRNSTVVFCRWQGMGHSAPRLAHVLKNMAKWKLTVDLDLDKPEKEWPSLIANVDHYFILADDFVGSGKTLVSLSASTSAGLPRLLTKYPESKALVLVVAGFEEGLKRARTAFSSFRERIRIIPGRLFDSADGCFDAKSRIISDPNQRKLLRDFCILAAKKHYPALPKGIRLGFGYVGAIIVFHDTVPNNSLPIIWHDEGSWFPLFPASGTP